MQWKKSGETYAAQPWNAGMPAIEATSLRELFGRVAQAETEHAQQRAMQRLMERRQRRIEAMVSKVDADLRRSGPIKRRRGAPAAVVVLYRVHPRTRRPWYTPVSVVSGMPPVYPTVTDAARTLQTKPDNICQAIRRRGVCGGLVFEYVANLPARHVCARAMSAVQATEAHEPPGQKKDALAAFRQAILCN